MRTLCWLFGCKVGWDHSMGRCPRCNAYILDKRCIDRGLFEMIRNKASQFIHDCKNIGYRRNRNGNI